MSVQLRREFGEELYQALLSGSTLAPLTERWPSISIEDAYHISLYAIERRVAAGEQIVGKKIGVTSGGAGDARCPPTGLRLPHAACRSRRCADFPVGQQPDPAPGRRRDRLHPQRRPARPRHHRRRRAGRHRVRRCRASRSSTRGSTTGRSASRTPWPTTPPAACSCSATAQVDPRELDLPTCACVLKNGEPAGAGLGSAVQGHPLHGGGLAGQHPGRARHSVQGRARSFCPAALAPLVPVRAGDRFQPDHRWPRRAARVSFLIA